MREAAGGVRVDEIRRQKADAEDVLAQVDGLDGETARLQAGLMSADERRETVARYEAMDDKPDVASWQIGVSEAIRDGRADEAVGALSDRDRLHVEKDLETTLGRLVDDWETWRRDNPDRVATVIARTHDEVGALSHIMRERVLGAAGGEDERVVVQACGARSDDDRERPLEIARGDLLRIGTLVWDKGLYNGTIVEVAGIAVHGEGTEDERVEIVGRTEYGGDVSFFVDELTDIFGRVRLDHGYAMTVASSQGRTVDAAFVLADDRAARPTIYPALTRHREHLEVYVNREPVALAVQARRPEDEQDAAVSDAEISAHLAQAWSRDGYKVAAHDFMSRRLADEVEATYPGGKGAAAWLAANDNRLGTLRGVGRAIRDTTDRWRHGRTVAGIGDELRDLDDAYDELTQKWAAAGGGRAELVGEFRAHAGQRRDLAARMAPFVARPGRYEALWRAAGGVAVRDVIDFRAGVEDLDAWVRRAGRTIQGRPAGDAPVDAGAAVEAEGGDMALASEGSALPDHARRAALVEACTAQAADRFRWLVEGEEHLARLYTRAQDELAGWPRDDREGRASVERFVADWPAAVRAWEVARNVATDLDQVRGGAAADRAAAVLRAIEAIEADAGALWHDETMRIIQRDLARRGTLVRADAWLDVAKADLATMVSAGETADVPPPARTAAKPEAPAGPARPAASRGQAGIPADGLRGGRRAGNARRGSLPDLPAGGETGVGALGHRRRAGNPGQVDVGQPPRTAARHLARRRDGRGRRSPQAHSAVARPRGHARGPAGGAPVPGRRAGRCGRGKRGGAPGRAARGHRRGGPQDAADGGQELGRKHGRPAPGFDAGGALPAAARDRSGARHRPAVAPRGENAGRRRAARGTRRWSLGSRPTAGSSRGSSGSSLMARATRYRSGVAPSAVSGPRRRGRYGSATGRRRASP